MWGKLHGIDSFIVNFKQNYFELFNLTESFQLDKEELADRYTRSQQSVHPDRYSSASEQEKRLSLQYSVLINQAYNTLKKPLTRAAYLLELNGIDTSGNQNAPVDSEFLLEQIELREALEEVEEHEKEEEQLNLLSQLKSRMENLRQTLEVDFDLVYGNQNLTVSEQIVYKMQFADKLLAEANRLEEKLLDY